MNQSVPASFSAFSGQPSNRDGLRQAITAAYRRSETDCVPELLDLAAVSPQQAGAIADTARKLVQSLRAKPRPAGMEALVHEYSLSTAEGIALMCLAEALLRTPDRASRDALIRDKVGKGDWRAHIGKERPLFVNAASWALMLTGRIAVPSDDSGLSDALSRLIARGGEPLVRMGVDTAMRLLGDHFVSGQTIGEALDKAKKREVQGFRYSYDMLGEAAMTARDADRYLADYESALHAIGKAAAGRGVYQGPGISIKLSALHPRYERSQSDRLAGELLPRLVRLCVLAKRYDIGLNIDAEEAERLELSLDLLERLAFHPDLAGWDGLGFVVQAYGKRCPMVIDYLIDLAQRAGRRLMVRLVKGAYWDTEIKRSQVLGLADYPVFTRKVHTDVSYQACVRKLLAAREAIYPQFATHNAQTVAYVMTMAAPWEPGLYEFQCLHGMGEPLYEEIVNRPGFGQPCRVYAPVGSHETLLAYLVRRLLENGANSSFVNQIADPAVSVEALIADPLAVAAATVPVGAPHAAIPRPEAILGARRNSVGLDLTNEDALADLMQALQAASRVEHRIGQGHNWRAVRNPANASDVVGWVCDDDANAVAAAFAAVARGSKDWSACGSAGRAQILEHAADLVNARMAQFMALLIREAGKSAANAIAEVREAVDFLRYYANEAHRLNGEALGVVAAISPWNFPLAIFTGQVAAALAAGNGVVAKPAEETPLMGAAAVALLHEAGVPKDALQLVLGAGEVGAAMVADARAAAVVFTGSTETARIINRTLAERVGPDGLPVVLIAETGGVNAMIVESSALSEQVVADVMASAFDSAGQRCSALRVLCLQDDIADKVVAMLKGAMAQARIGDTRFLASDIGPVISAEARDRIADYVARRAREGLDVWSAPLPRAAASGTFIAPTLITLNGWQDLEGEIFGPVLHVLRFARGTRDSLIAQINAMGYGLTFGLHTRIDQSIVTVGKAISAGNVYVNRNVIGAVVGVQPFGGHGLSGTGPKAGGPLYLPRLLRGAKSGLRGAPGDAAKALRSWAVAAMPSVVDAIDADMANSPLGYAVDLPGPVGETNRYEIGARGAIALLARSQERLLRQLSAVLATGNRAVIADDAPLPPDLPKSVADAILRVAEPSAAADLAGALVEGQDLVPHLTALAQREGPLVPVHGTGPDGSYALEELVRERTISINTAAAGGNASLMTIDAQGI